MKHSFRQLSVTNRRRRRLAAITIGSVMTVAVATMPQFAAGAQVTGGPTIVLAPPTAPRNIIAALSGPDQITVSWEGPLSTAGLPVVDYRVQASPSGVVVVTPGDQPRAVFTGLVPGNGYTFTVRATTALGMGVSSAPTAPVVVPFLVSSPSGPGVQAPPSNPIEVNASQIGAGLVTVTWRMPQVVVGGNVSSFRVTTVPDAGVQLVAGTSNAATFGGLHTGVTYYFLVRTVSAAGLLSSGALSNAVSVALVPGPLPTVIAPPVIVVPLPAQVSPIPTFPVPTVVVPQVPVTAAPLQPNVPSPPGVPRPCVNTRWPQYATGAPVNVRTNPNIGVYLWWDGGYWNLRTSNPSPVPVVFSGSFNANASISIAGVGLEKRSDLLAKNPKSFTFSFTSAGDVDAVRITASCATLLSLRVFLNGAAVPFNQVFVGAAAHSPASQPVVILR